MPTPNPDYNPDWDVIQDHHDKMRKRLDEEKRALFVRDNELYEQGNTDYDSPERLELTQKQNDLSSQLRFHQDECTRCLSTYQHPTIQDAAKWAFEHFDPNAGLRTRTEHKVDFEAKQSRT